MVSSPVLLFLPMDVLSGILGLCQGFLKILLYFILINTALSSLFKTIKDNGALIKVKRCHCINQVLS